MTQTKSHRRQTPFPTLAAIGILLCILNATLGGETLSNLIESLEKTRRSKADLAQLIQWELFDGQYARAATNARSLFILEPGWGPLFDELISRLAARNADASLTVRDLYGLPERERPGPRWMSKADLLRDTYLAGKIMDEDRFLAWIQELWYAKGWALTKAAIDIYERYGGKKDMAFLREIRGECFYKAGFYDDAIRYWKALYRKIGDEYYLYQQARIYFRLEQFAEAWGILKSMEEDRLKNFQYFYMLCKSARALNFNEEVRFSLSMARSKIANDRDSQLFQSLVN